jgi:CheY-like chemotaxis protein
MSDTNLLEGKKILIVDDEPDILAVLEDLLDMCELVKASSFEEAKTYLETQSFDIAVLDIMGVDGYGLLEIAKQKKIPALMLTAHAFTPDNLKEGRNPWETWQEKLPTSYFERRWGAAWKDNDQDFWNTFKASLKSRKK